MKRISIKIVPTQYPNDFSSYMKHNHSLNVCMIEQTK